MISPLSVKIGAITLVLLTLFGVHKYYVNEAVEHAHNEMLVTYNKQLLNNIMASVKSEDLIKEGMQEQLKAKDEKIASIDSERARLIRLLNDRPTRPSSDSENPGNSSSCTGTSLYREDGEFLTGEAASAAKVVVERDFYYNTLMNVKKELEELRNATNHPQ